MKVFVLLLCAPAVYGQIDASPVNDPGCKDTTGSFAGLLEAQGGEPMDTAEYFDNNGDLDDGGMPDYFEGHPRPNPLVKLGCSWTLDSRDRTPALIVLDMENGYFDSIDFIIPNAIAILSGFREKGWPVFWTNWARRYDDGFYGGLDRFYGAQGIFNKENPMCTFRLLASTPSCPFFLGTFT